MTDNEPRDDSAQNKPRLVARDINPRGKKISMSTVWTDEKLRSLTPEMIEKLPNDVWQKILPRLTHLRRIDNLNKGEEE